MAETAEQRCRRLGLAAPQEGPPAPAQYRQALAAARARLRYLAGGLEQEAGRPGGPAAFEQAWALCLELTRLGVELARRHGPEFLPAPDEAP